MGVVISSGHSKNVRGASGYLDEVNEARRVVERVADILKNADEEVLTFHDDTSDTQSENLETIVSFHNSCNRDLDVSIHFNAYVETEEPMGTECLYFSEDQLATEVALAIANAGHFIDRGAKQRSDLYFLNQTEEPAILIEVCFVDSKADADLYNKHFDEICLAIAACLMDESEAEA